MGDFKIVKKGLSSHTGTYSASDSVMYRRIQYPSGKVVWREFCGVARTIEVKTKLLISNLEEAFQRWKSTEEVSSEV